MILSRRRAHLYSSILLVCLLPIGFLAGILLRPQFEAVQGTTDVLFEKGGFAAANLKGNVTPIASTELGDKGIQLQVQTFLAEDGDTTEILLELKPAAVIQLPDLLVYWQEGEEAPGEIGDRSVFLGTLSGESSRVFTLPPQVRGKAGYLIVYTQVDQELVAAPPFPASMTAIKR